MGRRDAHVYCSLIVVIVGDQFADGGSLKETQSFRDPSCALSLDGLSLLQHEAKKNTCI